MPVEQHQRRRIQPTCSRCPPVIGPGYTFGSVTDKISAIALTQPTIAALVDRLCVAFALVMLLLYAIAYLLVSASASGVSIFPSPGDLPSSTSCGGSASAMRAR